MDIIDPVLNAIKYVTHLDGFKPSLERKPHPPIKPPRLKNIYNSHKEPKYANKRLVLVLVKIIS